MLEQEKFTLLEDKDIFEQLDLFTILYIDEINLGKKVTREVL